MSKNIQSLDKSNTFLSPEYDETAANDITSNLNTLHFNAGLNNNELLLKTLRKRAHTITVSICMHCTYFVCILNEARHIRGHIQATIPVPAKKLLLDESTPRQALTIGIIGCGRLGAQIARALLTFAEVAPRELLISSRRPMLLVSLQEQGVHCCYDNADVARRSHLLFLCVLPSQLEHVCAEISPHLAPRVIVYSLVAGVHQKRLSRLLSGHREIVHPVYTSSIDMSSSMSSMSSGISSGMSSGMSSAQTEDYGEIIKTFGSVAKLKLFCPVQSTGHSPILRSRSFVEQIVYALVNHCVNMSLSRSETVGVLNAVLLGENIKKSLDHKFQISDITCSNLSIEESATFPLVDLCSVVDDVETPVSSCLWTKVQSDNRGAEGSEVTTAAAAGVTQLSEAFVQQFVVVFRQYLDWKKESLRKARQQLLLIYE